MQSSSLFLHRALAIQDNSAPCRALFPIPENQISVNPNLEQNPEYPDCGDGVPEEPQ